MGLKIVTTNGLTNCKKLLADASSFTKENGIDITTAPVDFETPPLENENDTPWTMDLTVKAVEKRALVLGKNIQPVRWLKQEQMKGRHTDSLHYLRDLLMTSCNKLLLQLLNPGLCLLTLVPITPVSVVFSQQLPRSK